MVLQLHEYILFITSSLLMRINTNLNIQEIYRLIHYVLFVFLQIKYTLELTSRYIVVVELLHY